MSQKENKEKEIQPKCGNCYFLRQTEEAWGMCCLNYPVKKHVNDSCQAFTPEKKRDSWHYPPINQQDKYICYSCKKEFTIECPHCKKKQIKQIIKEADIVGSQGATKSTKTN